MYYILLSYGAEDEAAHGEAYGGLPFEGMQLSLKLLPSTTALTILSKDRVVDGEQRWHAIGTVHRAVLLVMPAYL